MDKFQDFLLFFPIILISVALHEFAHCWTDDRMGDDTPRLAGRVTLNPLVHLDPWGTIMMAISAFWGVGFGWGKPSPFNPQNFRNPALGRMIGAIAGPLSNILQMFAWASLGLLLQLLFAPHVSLMEILDGSGGWLGVAFTLCLYGVIINASLAIFNMLPIYPLDGHHVLSYFVPASWRPILDNPIWGLVLLFLIFNGHVLGVVLHPLQNGAIYVTRLLVGWPG